MSDRKRSLNDLRVIDLRVELEKRNLDKSGVRGVLIQRLAKHLEEEGLDPATFKFEISIPEGKTPSKRARRSESTVEPETEDTPAMEDMIVQDDAGDDDEVNTSGDKTSLDVKGHNRQNDDEKMEIDESKTSRKREIKETSEATQSKKLCIEKELKVDEDHNKVTESNTDAEDSINLDIGDDELLNEETDNTAKSKKDEDVHEDAAEAASGDATGDADNAAKDSTATADIKEEVNSETPATSENTDDKHSQETSDVKEKDDNDKKEKKEENKEGGARNLWVSGLSGDTRAKDLKQLCSKHGKVIGAKVVTNARTPGSRCYGYVTMASSQDAENCIKNLHRTELHGRMISVEKAKSESESATRRQAAARHPERRPSKDKSKEIKEEDKEDAEGTDNTEKNEKLKKEGDVSGAESNRSLSREKSHRSDKERAHRTRSRERRRSPREVLSFSKIWKERDVARARERSRAAREEERRRRAADEALRERERRQRQEKHRLALEREKLRAEREKIEREKNELLRLERERHRLEREKLELERMELKRAQLRLEEERRKRTGYENSAPYRKPASSPPPAVYDREARHKRPPPPPMSSSRGQFEAPPPPRFEISTSAYDRAPDKRDREYKRDYPRHVSSGNIKYPTNGNTSEDSRQPLPPGTRPKEPSRSYDSRDSRSYRPSPPGKPEPRNWNTSSRYPDSGPPTKSGGSEPWSSSGAGEARYGAGAGYEPRYAPAYQPPPPGAAYPDRYAPQPRDYRAKY